MLAYKSITCVPRCELELYKETVSLFIKLCQHLDLKELDINFARLCAIEHMVDKDVSSMYLHKAAFIVCQTKVGKKTFDGELGQGDGFLVE